MSDPLNDALDALRSSFEREAGEREDVLRKSLADAESTVDAVAAGADAVLAEFREQNEAICKGLTALIGAMGEQRREIDALRKSLDAGLDAPIPPRGVTGARPIPAPGDETPATEGEALFKSLVPRALAALARGDGDQHALTEAVSGLSVPGTNIWQRARRDPRAFAESLRLV